VLRVVHSSALAHSHVPTATRPRSAPHVPVVKIGCIVSVSCTSLFLLPSFVAVSLYIYLSSSSFLLCPALHLSRAVTRLLLALAPPLLSPVSHISCILPEYSLVGSTSPYTRAYFPSLASSSTGSLRLAAIGGGTCRTTSFYFTIDTV
jgi:hypothetical protein